MALGQTRAEEFHELGDNLAEYLFELFGGALLIRAEYVEHVPQRRYRNGRAGRSFHVLVAAAYVDALGLVTRHSSPVEHVQMLVEDEQE